MEDRTKRSWRDDGLLWYSRALDRYRETIAGSIPDERVGARTPSRADALALGLLLERLQAPVQVLDLGEPHGPTTTYFATHPAVDKIVCVDGSQMPHAEADRSAIERSLSGNPHSSAEIEFHDEIPTVEPPWEGTLISYIDRYRTSKVVREDLQAAFRASPSAIAVVPGCRGRGGPHVQAGIVSFLEETGSEFELRLVGDLTPGLAVSGLGIVYPARLRDATEQALRRTAGMFSERLDPLSQLEREQELIEAANGFRDDLERSQKELAEAQQRLRELEQKRRALRRKNSQLREHYSSRRYRLADLLAENLLPQAVIRRLLRGRRSEESLPDRH